MLSQVKQKELLNLIHEQQKALYSGSLETTVQFLEASYTLFHLKRILQIGNNSLSKKLSQFFSTRWSRISQSDIQYFFDFTNPANIACIEVAKAISGVTYLSLLIPPLAKTPITSYVTSSYIDGIDLKESMLDQTGYRVINIPDVMSGAQEDGVLKHNTLFQNPVTGHRDVKPINPQEKTILLSRHPAVQLHYENIQRLVNYKLHGDTLGARLNSLIANLFKGGVKQEGLEMDAGESANLAILEFDLYLQSLDESKKIQLMSAQKIDRFNSFEPQEISVQYHWQHLSRPLDKIKNFMHTTSVYCVELIAQHLDEILNNNMHLFDIDSFDETNSESINLSQLQKEYDLSEIKMKEALQTVTRHRHYGADAEASIWRNLKQKITRDKTYYLNEEDIAWLAKNYEKNKEASAQDILSFCVNTYSMNHLNKAMAMMDREVKSVFVRDFNVMPQRVTDYKQDFFSQKRRSPEGESSDYRLADRKRYAGQ